MRPRFQTAEAPRMSVGTDLCAEIVRFLLIHGPKAFDDWPPRTLRFYVQAHLERGSAIYAREGAGGPVVAALFAWPVKETWLRVRVARGKSPWDWETSGKLELVPTCDAWFVAEVVGRRETFRKMQWPSLEKLERFKLFTMRRGKLVRLRWAAVRRFFGIEKEATHGQ